MNKTTPLCVLGGRARPVAGGILTKKLCAAPAFLVAGLPALLASLVILADERVTGGPR
jgi:hypothetical protein